MQDAPVSNPETPQIWIKPTADDTPLQQPASSPAPLPATVSTPATKYATTSTPVTTTSSTRHAAFLGSGVPMAELDSVITGSMDLSGGRKDRIDHFRVDDSSALERAYNIGRKLGQGSFGTVSVIKEKRTSQMYACKMIKKKTGSRGSYEQLQREVAIMKIVRHPHIVQLHEVYETPKKMYLIMEYCEGGELVERIKLNKTCSESDARIIITKLADAVAYLHAHGVVHRDIKPENILLCTKDPLNLYNIKLSDFGLVTWVDNCSMMENVVGTPMYMAPEILQSLPYSAQCDIWSVGVLMYLLLCGYLREVEKSLHVMIMDGKIEYPNPFWRAISPAAKSLCDSMLKFDPAKRISAKEILLSPWIKGEEHSENMAVNTTVLDLMRSYNSYRRFKKALLVVRVAVRFMSPLKIPAHLRGKPTPPTAPSKYRSLKSAAQMRTTPLTPRRDVIAPIPQSTPGMNSTSSMQSQPKLSEPLPATNATTATATATATNVTTATTTNALYTHYTHQQQTSSPVSPRQLSTGSYDTSTLSRSRTSLNASASNSTSSVTSSGSQELLSDMPWIQNYPTSTSTSTSNPIPIPPNKPVSTFPSSTPLSSSSSSSNLRKLPQVTSINSTSRRIGAHEPTIPTTTSSFHNNPLTASSSSYIALRRSSRTSSVSSLLQSRMSVADSGAGGHSGSGSGSHTAGGSGSSGSSGSSSVKQKDKVQNSVGGGASMRKGSLAGTSSMTSTRPVLKKRLSESGPTGQQKMSGGGGGGGVSGLLHPGSVNASLRSSATSVKMKLSNGAINTLSSGVNEQKKVSVGVGVGGGSVGVGVGNVGVGNVGVGVGMKKSK